MSQHCDNIRHIPLFVGEMRQFIAGTGYAYISLGCPMVDRVKEIENGYRRVQRILGMQVVN